MARVVFMGTPEFALPALDALHAEHQVVLVVTQPDRRRGRGQKLAYPPVKEAALSKNLPLWQPPSLRGPEAIERLRMVRADVFVTAAIGYLIPPQVLAIPPFGCLNLHASLLPRWRGAAPISAAILHGDAETGVTLMLMDEGLDTGPILAQVRCPIQSDDTAATLTRRLARLGADLLIETLPRWLRAEITPRPQPGEGVTLAPRLKKADGRIDWRRSAVYIERMTRAYDPWPGAYTSFRGRTLKVLRARALPELGLEESPGRVVALEGGDIGVVTGKGVLVLVEIQLAGKRAMPTSAFCCGYRDFVGSLLG